MRVALIVSAMLLLPLTASGAVRACECAQTSAVGNFTNADVVFEGDLIRVTRLPSSSTYSFAYTFKVDRSLKEPVGSVVSVFGGATDCEASFQQGVKYRVYAKDDGGVLTSGACSGTGVIGLAGENTGQFVTRAFFFSPPFELARLVMKLFGVCVVGVLLGSGVFAWRRYFPKSLPS